MSSCRGHVWLITTDVHPHSRETIRVKCWLCGKRHRWPATWRSRTLGFYRDWRKRADSRA